MGEPAILFNAHQKLLLRFGVGTKGKELPLLLQPPGWQLILKDWTCIVTTVDRNFAKKWASLIQ